MTLYTNQYYRGRDKVLRRTQQISNASQEFPAALRGSTLVSRRSSSLCSLTPSALDQCVCDYFFIVDFHGFRGYRVLENTGTPPEPLRTFPNVVRECQQSLGTVHNTPMDADRQNPPHLDIRQKRPADTTHDHQRSTCSTGTRSSAVVHSQIGRGTTPCAIL